MGGIYFFQSDVLKQLAPLQAVIPNEPVASTTVPLGWVIPNYIAHGSQSQVKNRVNYLIQSEKELGDLWKLLNTDKKVPEVDFASKSVIAVFAGEKQTAGYDIIVQSVVDTQVREVTISLIKPGPGCVTGQVITAPYQLVEVPKTSLSLTHKDVDVIARCE